MLLRPQGWNARRQGFQALLRAGLETRADFVGLIGTMLTIASCGCSFHSHIRAYPQAMPTSAAARAGASFTPSPAMAIL